MRKLCSLFAVVVGAAAQSPAPALELGVFRGACDTDTADLWARATCSGSYVLELRAAAGPPLQVVAEAAPGADGTLHWRVPGLQLRSFTGYRVLCDGVEVASADDFAMAPAIGNDRSTANIAFGSCYNERRQGAQTVMAAIAAQRPDALVLLGDTPYIDSTSLAVHRRRHREFLADAGVAACLRAVATYWIWDDHDYTGNDRFGDVDGRAAARRAFVEYRAHGSYGGGSGGIHHRFRRGPIEVFLLDTRSFADTEPCPFAPAQRSLLGADQLRWLQAGLLASTAPFKVLASGMVWNGAVRAGKRDCWARWAHERDGLLRWIGAQRIGGVVWMGGDLHVARLIRHDTRALCGYDVPECITSPLANSTIEANAGAIDGVLVDLAVTSTYAVLAAETSGGEPRLSVRFHGDDGRVLAQHAFALAELTAPGR